ncbi:hypothetical protein ACFT54_09920 [Streptomyces cinereoruber]|uniref:hypothetical protein n=1 Tax=Streptomyces cinereoruber TaxID=67260 RepID=UPI00363DE378
MTTRPKKTSTPYEPSPTLTAAFAALAEAEQQETDARHAARQAVADELRASEQSNARIAEHTPWTEETVRGIAKEFGIPPRPKGSAAPPYDPSPAALKALTDAFEALREAEANTRDKTAAARAATAEELRTARISHAKMTPHTPWSVGTIRNIAEEYDVPPVRRPSVPSTRR